MYLCILDHDGNKLLHRNVRAKPREFVNAIDGFRDDLVVGVSLRAFTYRRQHL
jgi:hypothetical protein